MSLWSRMRLSLRDWLGTWSSGDKALANLFGYGPTSSGVDVTEEGALNIAAVWACVQLISGNVGSLPLIHYRVTNKGREPASDSRLYRLLHDAPNDEATATTFLETLQSHVLLWGNAFAEIVRDRSGRVAELHTIEPWRVFGVRPSGYLGPLRYRITQRDGTTVELDPENIIHVPGLTPNGVWGYSVIRKARESYGLTMATERFGSSFFGKGSTFGGILSHPGTLTEEQQQKLRASLEKRHQGVDRAHQFIILQGGMKFESLGIPGRDAQFLQQRQFQIAEVARWFGVPPHLIGDTEKSTSWGTGIQQQTIGFLQFTLRRWLVKIEKEFNRKLISPLERNLQLIEFKVDGLERADQESRYRAYEVGIRSGFLRINEVRRFENLPEVEGGDITLVPLNMTTPDKLDQEMPTPPPPAEPAPDAEDEADDADRKQIAEDIKVLMALGRDAQARLEAIPPPPPPEPVDFGPVMQRLDAVQAAIPEPTAPVDLAPVLDAVASIPIPPSVDLAPVMEGLEAVRAAIPEPPAPVDLAPVIDAVRAIPVPAPTDLSPVLEALGAAVVNFSASVPAAPPPTDLTPVLDRLERLEAIEAEQRAMRERVAALAPMLRELIVEAVRREAKFEADRAKKAAQSPEKLRAWMETFYATREDTAAQYLLPTMRLHFQLTGRLDDAEAETRRLIREHVNASRAALEVLLGDPETLEANVRALAARWESERPKAIADACLSEVIACQAP